MPSPALDRSARLNMRIAPHALATIRDAAAAQQQDVTSFVLGAALDQARSILVADRMMRLTQAEVSQLSTALDAEPSVVPELAALIREVKGARRKTRIEIPVR